MMIWASGSISSFFAAVPIRYIIRLSTFRRLAVFAAEPKAMPMSKALKRHIGPAKSWPCLFPALSKALHVV